jgi:hypothetical protein
MWGQESDRASPPQRSFCAASVGERYAPAYTLSMFARKIRVEYFHDGVSTPAPIHWLDNFAMRSFTNDSVFDDTLPVADGLLEIGSRVPLDLLADRLTDWCRRKGYLGSAAVLRLTELESGCPVNAGASHLT